MFRLFRAIVVVSLAPFALSAIYTWWFASRHKEMSQAELIHGVVHMQPGVTLYSLCNLVVYGWIVPVTVMQTALRTIARKRRRPYKMGQHLYVCTDLKKTHGQERLSLFHVK